MDVTSACGGFVLIHGKVFQNDIVLLAAGMVVLVVALALVFGARLVVRHCKEAYGAKVWTNEVVVAGREGGAMIRGFEKVDRAAWPSGTYGARFELWYSDGGDWRLVDTAPKRTPCYTNLYRERDRFFRFADQQAFYDDPDEGDFLGSIAIKEAMLLKFPTAATYKAGHVWDILVSPEDFGPG